VNKWRIAPEDEARKKWDAWLRAFPEAYAYQSVGWADYKRRSGWEPLRVLLPDRDGVPRAMAQALLKRVPILGTFAWLPGGPTWVGVREPGDMRLLADLLQTSVRPWYVRLFHMSEGKSLLEAPWELPSVRNGSGMSLIINLALPLDSWLLTITSKHRYYVRRALREPIEWRVGNSESQLDDLAGLTAEMWRLKQGRGRASTKDDLRLLCEALGTNVKTLIGYLEGRPVTGCQVLRWGSRYIYATAATNNEGRSASAAYAMIAQLREVLREEGGAELDFGGLDPGNAEARGVDHFKLGFGGRQITYGGEWEWASSSATRALGSFVIAARRRG